MAQLYSNILSESDIDYILGLSEVISSKNKLQTQNVVKFTIILTNDIKQKIQEKLGINLQGINTIPMRWIKGDTAPHIDVGDKFLNTYLLYLNDSQGELVLGKEYYPIVKNNAYVFNEGLNHYTVNTGLEPRLMIGPMSENAIMVGVEPIPIPPPYPPPPYNPQICIEPPYNANNFTSANAPVYSTLVSYAQNSPNFPWATGSNAQQIYRSQQNVSYFNGINQQTQAIRTANGLLGTRPYPQFKTDAERLMYIQGQALTAARNRITGQNPSGPAGVPCSTIYGIINS